MKRLASFLLLSVATMALASGPCTDEEFSKKVAEGLPRESEAIALRIMQCNQWGEETGYGDKERAAQVAEGVEKSKCGSLQADKAALIKKYPDNKKIGQAFAAAESWEGVCDEGALERVWDRL